MCSRVVCFALFFTIFSCKNDAPPEPPKPATITLKSEDASCTEAWLKATTTETPVTVRLLRDGQRVSNLRLLTSDSLLLNEGLLPRRTYNYQLQKLATDSSVVETSAIVQVTTMDTTSHNFTWQVDTLGDASINILRDVSLINDTSIWAVGEIRYRDSTGGAQSPYNIAKWNGSRWQLLRLPFPQYNFDCTVAFYSSASAIAVFSFGNNNVLFTDGASVARWNGSSFVHYTCAGNPVDLGFYKIWGTSENNFWCVGRNGVIMHFNNGTWQREQSGTSVALIDVWGVSPASIWACGIDLTTGQRSVLLRWDGMLWRTAYQYNGGSVPRRPDSLSGSIQSVWTDTYRKIWLTTSVAEYAASGNSTGAGRLSWAPSYLIGFLWSNRGSLRNNIFVAGDFGTLAHFNGSSWHHFIQFMDFSSQVSLKALSVSNSQACAVGFVGSTAIAFRGRKP